VGVVAPKFVTSSNTYATTTISLSVDTEIIHARDVASPGAVGHYLYSKRERQEERTEKMRSLATKMIFLLVIGGLFSYLVLPGLIEDQVAQRLQTALGSPTEPDVEVSSSFPPEMLLGQIDRIEVSSDQMSLQGFALYNARADLRDVNVSVSSIIDGHPTIETQSCSLSVEVPALLVEQNEECLGYLGLGSV
jgi:hypothetical protein